jgi:hypothetical protein
MKTISGLVGVLAGCSLYFPADSTDAPQKPRHDASLISPDVPPPGGLLPDPPGPTRFMWPSLQEHFRSSGVECTGQVTLAVGDQVVCYVGVDDDLHCAGNVYTTAFGSSFVAVGKPGVDQITISATVSSATGNSMCIHETSGAIECLGDGNANGAFGNGTTDPSATWTQFGAAHDWARFTATNDAHCALDSTQAVYCAGYEFGITPVEQGSGGEHVSVYIDDFGSAHVDDPAVWRASNGSPCSVQADGLHCNAPMAESLSGSNGVVDGTISQAPDGPIDPSPVCWLDETGTVSCGVSNISEQEFASASPIVALAGNFYTDTRCAVSDDGSLWCLGTNAHGELGIGSTTAVTTETMVQPPLSVKAQCY